MDARGLYDRHRTPILIGWVVLSGALAVIYLFVYPARDDAGPVTTLILRYFHALTWLLLGLAGAVALFRRGSPISGRLAYAGLGTYLVFVTAFVLAG